MPLFGAPNVEKLQAKGNVKGLIKALGYGKDSSVRYDAAKALGKIGGTPAVGPLVAALSDANKHVRQQAAWSLGRLGDARAVEPLIALLQDDEESVLKAAVLALGQIGDSRAQAPLVSVLTKGDQATRRAAADALDELGWTPDRDEAGASYWAIRREWHKCVEIGSPAVETLISALKHRDKQVRQLVARGLGQIGDARAVRPLLNAIRDSDIYQEATDALAQFGASAVEPLVDALQDRNLPVRNAAAQALGHTGDPRAAKVLLRELRGPNSRLREETIVSALVQIGTPIVDMLIKEITGDWSLYRFNAAIEALGRIGDMRAVEPLTAALKMHYAGTREAAAGALDRLGWQPGRDETGAIFCIVRKKWDRCVEIGVPAVRSLVATLQGGNAVMRSNAATALRQICEQQQDSALDTQVAELLVAAMTKNRDMCSTVAQELGPLVPQAIELLIAALQDQDRCQAAAKALDELGWQPGRSKAGASYWAATQQWTKCVEIGSPAVETLVAALNLGDKSARQGAARALVKIYQSGELDDTHKQLILDQRSAMTAKHSDGQPHTDKRTHHDGGASCNSYDCHDDWTGKHSDRGIGIRFPL